MIATGSWKIVVINLNDCERLFTIIRGNIEQAGDSGLRPNRK
jgi:hypothetical protein